MAIEYNLVIDSATTPADLLRRLASSVSMQFNDVPISEASADGISCTAIPQSKIGQELIYETFGIRSSVTIGCRLDKFELLPVGMNRLVDLCICLIQTEPYDFVLLANGESGRLLRVAGVLQADCRDEYWKERWESALSSRGIEFLPAALPTI